jgi:2-hydroxychromene-2-carboxylate isomerase
MHDRLFENQDALGDDDLTSHAAQLGLDLDRLDHDRNSIDVLQRMALHVESGSASGEVLGTPILFIDGVVYRGDHDGQSLFEVMDG